MNIFNERLQRMKFSYLMAVTQRDTAPAALFTLPPSGTSPRGALTAPQPGQSGPAAPSFFAPFTAPAVTSPAFTAPATPGAGPRVLHVRAHLLRAPATPTLPDWDATAFSPASQPAPAFPAPLTASPFTDASLNTTPAADWPPTEWAGDEAPGMDTLDPVLTAPNFPALDTPGSAAPDAAPFVPDLPQPVPGAPTDVNDPFGDLAEALAAGLTTTPPDRPLPNLPVTNAHGALQPGGDLARPADEPALATPPRMPSFTEAMALNDGRPVPAGLPAAPITPALPDLAPAGTPGALPATEPMAAPQPAPTPIPAATAPATSAPGRSPEQPRVTLEERIRAATAPDTAPPVKAPPVTMPPIPMPVGTAPTQESPAPVNPVPASPVTVPARPAQAAQPTPTPTIVQPTATPQPPVTPQSAVTTQPGRPTAPTPTSSTSDQPVPAAPRAPSVPSVTTPDATALPAGPARSVTPDLPTPPVTSSSVISPPPAPAVPTAEIEQAGEAEDAATPDNTSAELPTQPQTAASTSTTDGEQVAPAGTPDEVSAQPGETAPDAAAEEARKAEEEQQKRQELEDLMRRMNGGVPVRLPRRPRPKVPVRTEPAEPTPPPPPEIPLEVAQNFLARLNRFAEMEQTGETSEAPLLYNRLENWEDHHPENNARIEDYLDVGDPTPTPAPATPVSLPAAQVSAPVPAPGQPVPQTGQALQNPGLPAPAPTGIRAPAEPAGGHLQKALEAGGRHRLKAEPRTVATARAREGQPQARPRTAPDAEDSEGRTLATATPPPPLAAAQNPVDEPITAPSDQPSSRVEPLNTLPALPAEEAESPTLPLSTPLSTHPTGTKDHQGASLLTPAPPAIHQAATRPAQAGPPVMTDGQLAHLPGPLGQPDLASLLPGQPVLPPPSPPTGLPFPVEPMTRPTRPEAARLPAVQPEAVTSPIPATGAPPQNAIRNGPPLIPGQAHLPAAPFTTPPASLPLPMPPLEPALSQATDSGSAPTTARAQNASSPNLPPFPPAHTPPAEMALPVAPPRLPEHDHLHPPVPTFDVPRPGPSVQPRTPLLTPTVPVNIRVTPTLAPVQRTATAAPSVPPRPTGAPPVPPDSPILPQFPAPTPLAPTTPWPSTPQPQPVDAFPAPVSSAPVVGLPTPALLPAPSMDVPTLPAPAGWHTQDVSPPALPPRDLPVLISAPAAQPVPPVPANPWPVTWTATPTATPAPLRMPPAFAPTSGMPGVPVPVASGRPQPAQPTRPGLPSAFPGPQPIPVPPPAVPDHRLPLEQLSAQALQADGHGTPLPLGVQEALHRTLGTSVQDIRVVRSAQVPALLAAANADGLTVDRTVFLPAHVDLSTPAGHALAAHEFTHALRRTQLHFTPDVVRRAGPTPTHEEELATLTEHLAHHEAHERAAPARATTVTASARPTRTPRETTAPRAPITSSPTRPDVTPPTTPAAPPTARSAPSPQVHAADANRAAPQAPAPPPASKDKDKDTAVGSRQQTTPQVDLDQVARDVYARLRERLGEELRRLHS